MILTGMQVYNYHLNKHENAYISHIESLITNSMSLSAHDRFYTLSHVQQLILDTFPLVHTKSHTKRLIILYSFIESVLSHS